MKAIKGMIFGGILSLTVSGCILPEQPASNSVRKASVNAVDGVNEPVQLMKLTDLENRLKGTDQLPIREQANILSEVDGWFFDDEELCRKRIDQDVDKLRSRIEVEIRKLLDESVKLKSGKDASKLILQVNSYLLLYPVPKTDEQRKSLESVSDLIVNTSRRIEEIKRLRYNEWAIQRVESALQEYRNILKVNGILDLKKLIAPHKGLLVNNCVAWLSKIDPTYLEPATLDLYNYVFGLTRDAIGNDDAHRVALSRGIANPSVQRKSPSDF